MSDRAIIVAALIVGGAIVAATSQTRTRYALSAADQGIAWRMDTWSGQVDLCTATTLPTGPLVRCGIIVVAPIAADPATTTPPTPQLPPTLDGSGNQTL
jgi:hypothetical protein